MAHRTSRALAGWTRLGDRSTKIGAVYAHESGWSVRHCGHPTANWPYYAVDPSDAADSRYAVTHNGKGFRTAQLAMEAVEGVLAGTIINTIEGCGGQTRRLLTPEELQDWRENAWTFGDRSGR
jgi:hypothetical protein